MRERRLFSTVAWAGLILIVALATRSFWVAYAPRDPSEEGLVNDTFWYFSSGASLAAGHGYVWPGGNVVTAFYPPGYPLLLAGLFKLFGVHVSVVWGTNIVLGALTCVALYASGSLMVDRRVGRAAGLLMAVFPAHIFFSSLVLSEVFFTFLVVLSMALGLLIAKGGAQRTMPATIALGLVVGAAALVRGQGLLLVPSIVLFWLVHSKNWAWALKRGTVVVLTAIVLVAPWTIRNWVQMGSPVFISTNDGLNFYMGHHEGATGGFMLVMGLPSVGAYERMSPPRREVALRNTEIREGFKFMFTHPGEELRLVLPKLQKTYENANIGLWWSAPVPGKNVAHFEIIRGIAVAFYYAVAAASLAAVLFWLRHRRMAIALPLIVIGVFSAGQVLFFGDAHYQFPMLPAFALLAAAGLTAVFDRSVWRRRRPGSRFD